MIKVISIAGSDPSSGAGIQADLKTFQALDAFGMAIPAALTVQNSRGVSRVQPVENAFFAQQLEILLSDIRPDALKTGMLLSRQNIQAAARAVKKFKIRNVIIDPVVRSSSGKLLLTREGLKAVKKDLLPIALLVTPNIPETEALVGSRVTTDQDMDYAAGKLLDMGVHYVLIKGGHRKGPATDTLYGGKQVVTFSTSRRKGLYHGTGCLLSSAITVFIARGYPVEKAVEKSKEFVDKMLIRSVQVGKGRTRYFQF